MSKQTQNIEKLELLIDMFVKDVGEGYFEKLHKIYEVLQKTLLNKEYVENLTEEKLDNFVEENKELLKYFDYFDCDEYFEYDDFNPSSDLLYYSKKLYLSDEDYKKQEIKFGITKEKLFKRITDFYLNINVFSRIKELRQLEEEEKKGFNIFDEAESDYFNKIPMMKESVISNNQALFNFSYPKFNHYITEFNYFGLKGNYEIEDDDIKFLSNVFEKQIDLNYKKQIPIGILFFHFYRWYSKKLYLTEIKVADYFSLKNIYLPKLSKEVYLLGENGVGKTILLQSIFIAMQDPEIQTVEMSKIAEALDILNKNKNFASGVFPFISNNNLVSILAYGVNRNNISIGLKESFEFMTLFSKNYKLRSPIDWFKNIYNQENEEKVNPEKAKPHIKLADAEKMFADLLEKNIEIEVSATNVSFTEKGNKLDFDSLADGYKSVIVWVTDMISRLLEKQSGVTNLKDFKGIVLIDELDLFLHPKWAYKIMGKLRGWFPNIQFIISTHSPVLILGASEDAIFYKVYKDKEGNTNVSEPVTDISGLTANSLLTSPIWDLDDFTTRGTKLSEITEADYIYQKIYQEVDKRRKENPNIIEDDVINFINEELDKLEI